MPKDRPRFIKSHLPLSMLPPNLLTKAKVVYVARNPKDCMVSYYHHHKLISGHGYVGDLPNFARRFMKNEVMYGSIFPHAKEAWALKDDPNNNMLFVFYEDMKADLMKVIDDVSRFLDCSSSLTPEKKQLLVDHLDIKNFRNNKAVNPTQMMKTLGLFVGDGNFVREGRVSGYHLFLENLTLLAKVGGGEEELAQFPEVKAEFEEWVNVHVAASPVPFPIS